jgi:methylphosphotriester-DNA--protein-cysteine methyltransferase
MESHLKPYSTRLQRWTAIRSRDPDANSAFYYGVTSTSIFCRPTCPARVARRDNIKFFDDVLTAQNAGYRPCKRCDPENTSWHRDLRSWTDFDAAKALIEQAEKHKEEWTVAEIAEKVGVSIGHLHRLFKRFANTTPKEFACIDARKPASKRSTSCDWTAIGLQVTDPFCVYDFQLDNCTRSILQDHTYSSAECEAFNHTLDAGGLLPGTGEDVWINLHLSESHDVLPDPSTINDLDWWDYPISSSELTQPEYTGLASAYDALPATSDSQLSWDIFPNTDGLY